VNLASRIDGGIVATIRLQENSVSLRVTDDKLVRALDSPPDPSPVGYGHGN